MTIIICSVCGKVIQPAKPTHRPYLVFYINEPCPNCKGKIDVLRMV